MSTSSILTTTQLDRSLFSDDPEGAVKEFLLDVCSLSEVLDLGLDCPSKVLTRERKPFVKDKIAFFCMSESASLLDHDTDVLQIRICVFLIIKILLFLSHMLIRIS